MKSSETKSLCPVCSALISTQSMKHHISLMATMERKSNLQGVKKHHNYKCREEVDPDYYYENERDSK
jgi:hypothetical protein